LLKKEAAVRSPVTLAEVLLMSRIRSTPRMRAIPDAGIPTDSRIVARITIPTPGAEGAPIEAPTVIATMKIMLARERSTPKTWARKTVATT